MKRRSHLVAGRLAPTTQPKVEARLNLIDNLVNGVANNFLLISVQYAMLHVTSANVRATSAHNA